MSPLCRGMPNFWEKSLRIWAMGRMMLSSGGAMGTPHFVLYGTILPQIRFQSKSSIKKQGRVFPASPVFRPYFIAFSMIFCAVVPQGRLYRGMRRRQAGSLVIWNSFPCASKVARNPSSSSTG